MQRLKETYKLQTLRDLNKQEVNMYLATVITQDAALKGFVGEKLPSKIHIDDIKNLIYTKFSFLTLPEIKLAIEIDRYEEDTNKKIKHYQFYNSEYMALILGNYCKWKREKAILHNLSRTDASKQVEFKIDEDKINQEYLNTLLDEIRSGKEHRYIEAHMLFNELPNEFKPNKAQVQRLITKEVQVLKKENESKRNATKGTIFLKNLIANQKTSFKSLVENRVKNVIVCYWLETTKIKEHGTNKPS